MKQGYILSRESLFAQITCQQISKGIERNEGVFLLENLAIRSKGKKPPPQSYMGNVFQVNYPSKAKGKSVN